MKNLILLASILLSSTNSVLAQKLFVGADLGGIIPAGKNNQNIPRNNYFVVYNYYQISRTTSWNFGINIDYMLSKRWSLSSKINFSKEGFKNNYGFISDVGPFDYYQWEIQTKYAYLRIPILTQYKLLENKNGFGLSLAAGPNLGINIWEQSIMVPKNENSQKLANVIENALEEQISNGDIAFQFGVKAHKNFQNKNRLFFEIQCMQSLADITTMELNLMEDNIVNRRLYFNIGYQIGL